MALEKVTYVNNQTVITAEQMNAIQDAIIANEKKIVASPVAPEDTSALWVDISDNASDEIPSGGSGGGSDFSLPLLYEVTTTEEVRWIDTGDNAFEAKNIVVIELRSKATASNEADKPISCSIYTENNKPTSPWLNCGLLNGNGSSDANAIMKQYDKLVRILGFAGDNGDWSAICGFRNSVNSAPQTPIMSSSLNSNLQLPIKGIIIGDASATAGTRVFGIGTTLKVWGC